MKMYKILALNYSAWCDAMGGCYYRTRKVYVKANTPDEAKKIAKTIGKTRVYAIEDIEEIEKCEIDFETIWIEPARRPIRRTPKYI